jgi:hypothetical protein
MIFITGRFTLISKETAVRYAAAGLSGRTKSIWYVSHTPDLTPRQANMCEVLRDKFFMIRTGI